MTTAHRAPVSAIRDKVKLVIWDLDDTFWQGVLSEGPIIPIERNIELVRLLARRGIVSSICSKNSPAAAEQELRTIGVWDYFVLPAIAFQAKSASIVAIIDALRLRPDNVVFVDDNPSVLAEVKFACPNLMCLNSSDELAAQLDSPHLQGAPDHELEKLKQYKIVAARHDNLVQSTATPEDFLRQSGITVQIDYDIDPHIDRIIDLLNKSNQLNFTKSRVDGEDNRATFLNALRSYGFNAGIVRVRDKYGDYGIVGFFMTLATLRDYELQHFVFSCRIMNMGVEQYVYNYLKRPSINIRGPVANPIEPFNDVDWISEAGDAESIVELQEFKLVLIGGCDMLQLSTYSSTDSIEFTNRDERGLMKRLDDPFLIIGEPDAVRQSPIRSLAPACSADEMLALREAVGAADVVVLSVYRMMEINYFRGSDGLMVRFDEDTVVDMLKSDQALWFVRNFTFVEYSHNERCGLISRCFETLSASAKPDAKIIVILENTRKLEKNPNEFHLRTLYNDFVKSECRRVEKLGYIDINQATNVDWLYDDGFHMHRQGYYELALAVKQAAARGSH